MLNFKTLELSDKTVYEGYTLCHGYHNLEASFANVYLWGRAMNLIIAPEKDAMYLLVDSGSSSFMLAPFLVDCEVNYSGPLELCEQVMRKRYGMFLLKGVTSEQKNKIEEDCPGKYVFTPDRANFEYVYLAQDLITLQGKKFHAKRNHINKLLKEHTCEYRRYKSGDFDACMALQNEWLMNREDGSETYDMELKVVRDALSNLETLNLKCGLLFIDGILRAFSIGERFGEDMAIIHIEKASPELPEAFTLINREFAKNEFSDVKYINREEDMGIEGLRKAKLSYNPVFLLEKFDCIKAP